MLNRVVLLGRLVADPELKTTNTGISVTSFRIAVDRSYVKAGEERKADFFDIVAWRSSAEFVCRNFAKGSLIAVDGQLQSRQYETKDGQKRTAIEVVADYVSFTGERRDAPSVEPQQAQPQYQPPASPYVQQPQQYAQQYQQPAQYPQHAQGAAYDPRYQQGMIHAGYTADDDIPF